MRPADIRRHQVGLGIGDAAYAMSRNSDGIILDDTGVHRRTSAEYLVIPNIGHDAESVRESFDFQAASFGVRETPRVEMGYLRSS